MSDPEDERASNPEPTFSSVGADLRSLSTRWSNIESPQVFALRYVEPMRGYLQRLLNDENDVDDVLQRLLVKFLQDGFSNASPDRGRFRHYLIRSVANEARTWLRERQRDQKRLQYEPLEALAANDSSEPSTAWDEDWKANLMQRAYRSLLLHQDTHPGSWCYDILRIASAHPNEGARQWCERLRSQTEATLSEVAFRKQLSRARSMLRKSIVDEVAATLDAPTESDIKDELRVLGWTRWLDDQV